MSLGNGTQRYSMALEYSSQAAFNARHAWGKSERGMAEQDRSKVMEWSSQLSASIPMDFNRANWGKRERGLSVVTFFAESVRATQVPAEPIYKDA